MILAILAILVIGPLRPDPALTPGVLALDAHGHPLSVAQVCTTKWGKDARHVTEAMKQEVARRYHVTYPLMRKGHRLTAAEKAQRAKFEVDHLLSRENGGADDVDNLWLQPWDGPLGAHAKDKVENALHRAVCRGDLTLEAAQQQLRRWGR
jgi:hypothetical protein